MREKPTSIWKLLQHQMSGANKVTKEENGDDSFLTASNRTLIRSARTAIRLWIA